jgi:dipeptidyl aminopeptidase/acylaminoacyl peptidase
MALSPDGQWLAYVLRRSKESALVHQQKFDQTTRLEGNDRGDIWLVPTAGGDPENLTHGAVDGAGYWMPTWSPDGERLAMLSNKGGNIQVWLWDRTSKHLRQLTQAGVDLQFRENPIVWISDHQLVCPVLQEGERPLSMDLEVRAAERAMEFWPKSWRGQEPAVSYLESGVSAPLEQRPQGRLLLVDLIKGTQDLTSGSGFSRISLSPNRRFLAFLKQVDIIRPTVDHLLPHHAALASFFRVYRLEIIDLMRTPSPHATEVTDTFASTLRWSPDGNELSAIGRSLDASNAPPSLFRCRASEAKCQAVVGLDPMLTPAQPAPTVWTTNGELLVLAEPGSQHAASRMRRDWWAVSPEGRLRNVTEKVRSVPAELFAANNGRSFVGIAADHVWELSLDNPSARDLTEHFGSKIASIVWPRQEAAEPAKQLVVGVQRDQIIDLYTIDLVSNRIEPLPKPSPKASLVEVCPVSGMMVFTAAEPSGSYLWLSQPAIPAFVPIVEINTFLNEVKSGVSRQIEYRGLDGQNLKAWLILPVNYEEGQRYPMVTWVYASSIAGKTPSALANINNPISLNLQLLASHGYAVLLPSMPLSPVVEDGGVASDPYMELTKGVLPAVDKAIELGIADPNRLGLMGQSYGGYSVYGLVTQTHRFQAAISLAGLSDLVSFYGQFDARLRYEAYPHEMFFPMSLSESGQLRMGNPPWKDLERYLRNSPIAYVDRVSTPLFIIQGDMDFVAIQQGEQFFTALYRQNKRAAFARYWGEGHVLESPANIRDMWDRIFRWFDEFLKPRANKTAEAGPGS